MMRLAFQSNVRPLTNPPSRGTEAIAFGIIIFMITRIDMISHQFPYSLNSDSGTVLEPDRRVHHWHMKIEEADPPMHHVQCGGNQQDKSSRNKQ